MATPGFEFLKRIQKNNGTHERIELNSNGYALKKYTTQNGYCYSGIQSPNQSHSDFMKEVKTIDNLSGFRELFK